MKMVSARTQEIIGSVHSDKGFYIGDICYALADDVYNGIWGHVHGFDDGCFEVPKKGHSFGVGSTAYGDGCYEDEDGNKYGVDAGVIGIVPLELCEKGTSGGTVIETPGDSRFEFYEGRFRFMLPGGKEVRIDTNYEDDEDDYEEDYNCYCEDEDDSAEGWD